MSSVKRKLEIFCVLAFVVVNLAAPMVVGEMYPFTISPMFSDQPCEYCVYEVFDENGLPIDAELFGLHLVYDGNPTGLGMGIQAEPTLHGFGETATVDQLRLHVQTKLTEMPKRKFVTVRRCLVRCVDHCPVEAVVEVKVDRVAGVERLLDVEPDTREFKD